MRVRVEAVDGARLPTVSIAASMSGTGPVMAENYARTLRRVLALSALHAEGRSGLSGPPGD